MEPRSRGRDARPTPGHQGQGRERVPHGGQAGAEPQQGPRGCRPGAGRHGRGRLGVHRLRRGWDMGVGRGRPRRRAGGGGEHGGARRADGHAVRAAPQLCRVLPQDPGGHRGQPRRTRRGAEGGRRVVCHKGCVEARPESVRPQAVQENGLAVRQGRGHQGIRRETLLINSLTHTTSS
ncbi:hypothetical protein ACQ4PT_022983 [Festuca glaucescens]